MLKNKEAASTKSEGRENQNRVSLCAASGSTGREGERKRRQEQRDRNKGSKKGSSSLGSEIELMPNVLSLPLLLPRLPWSEGASVIREAEGEADGEREKRSRRQKEEEGETKGRRSEARLREKGRKAGREM